MPAVTADEVGELLYCGDNDPLLGIIDLGGQLRCGLVGGDGSGGEAVVLLDGLVVEVLAIDDEEDLVHVLEAGGELGGLERGDKSRR